MRADTKYGETAGGLQAPFVVREGNLFYMFYGNWEDICLATSTDGKTFTRHADKDGKTALFTEGRGNNTRDPMVFRSGDRWYCYYTAYPNNQGADYCRTSRDLLHWSDSHVVALGGQSGTGRWSAECPFIVSPKPSKYFLFRTQRYGKDAKTSVYHSNDLMKFGLNEDNKHFVGTLPVAAPEIISNNGEYYVAALLPSLKGIQIAKLRWTAN
jgi:sucrose-6-phosphate hydrolase SacC (GH32 family)